MENKFEVDINVVLEMYKKKLSIVEHENILLNARLLQMELKASELKTENKESQYKGDVK